MGEISVQFTGQYPSERRTDEQPALAAPLSRLTAIRQIVAKRFPGPVLLGFDSLFSCQEAERFRETPEYPLFELLKERFGIRVTPEWDRKHRYYAKAELQFPPSFDFEIESPEYPDISAHFMAALQRHHKLQDWDPDNPQTLVVKRDDLETVEAFASRIHDALAEVFKSSRNETEDIVKEDYQDDIPWIAENEERLLPQAGHFQDFMGMDTEYRARICFLSNHKKYQTAARIEFPVAVTDAKEPLPVLSDSLMDWKDRKTLRVRRGRLESLENFVERVWLATVTYRPT